MWCPYSLAVSQAMNHSPKKARSGWDRGCIGTGADGRAKVTIEQAELIVAKYAQSNIMEGEIF